MRASLLFHFASAGLVTVTLAACTRTSSTEPARAGSAHDAAHDGGVTTVPAPANAMATVTAAGATAKPPVAAAPSCDDGLPEQSCAPGPAAADWNCKGGCAQECGECSQKCADASCRQSCLAARDRCATGKCAREMKAYIADMRKKFGCKGPGTLIEVCERIAGCIGGCNDNSAPFDPPKPCTKRCLTQHAQGCDMAVPYNAQVGACGAFELPAP